MQRRSFLAASAAAPLVAAASGAASAATPATAFDRTAFEAVLTRPYRHRQVFAAVKLDGARVLHYMSNSIKAYADGFGEGPGTLHAAAVLYGTSLSIALEDAMWAKYKIASVLDPGDVVGDAGERNPRRVGRPPRRGRDARAGRRRGVECRARSALYAGAGDGRLTRRKPRT